MSPNDIDYYRARFADERAAASHSANEHVAEIHEELARQYEALVEHAELRPSFRTIRAAA